MGNIGDEEADWSWLTACLRRGLSYTILSAAWLGPDKQELERRESQAHQGPARSCQYPRRPSTLRKRHSPPVSGRRVDHRRWSHPSSRYVTSLDQPRSVAPSSRQPQRPSSKPQRAPLLPRQPSLRPSRLRQRMSSARSWSCPTSSRSGISSEARLRSLDDDMLRPASSGSRRPSARYAARVRTGRVP